MIIIKHYDGSYNIASSSARSVAAAARPSLFKIQSIKASITSDFACLASSKANNYDKAGTVLIFDTNEFAG